jgi:4'-phosphopantetheinyl transferase
MEVDRLKATTLWSPALRVKVPRLRPIPPLAGWSTLTVWLPELVTITSSSLLPVEETTCQVWWAAPAMARSWHDDLLTPAERARAAKLVREADRRRLIVGNALLRLALARLLGQKPVIDRSCPDCGAPHGKPRVVGHDVHVSVSHSGARIAVAITQAAPVGVDVEEITDISTDELRRMVVAPHERVAMGFFEMWARKEAVLKALGHGLRTPMTSITLTPQGVEGLDCTVTPLDAGKGYAAALAVLTAQPVTVSEVDGSALLL